jgi:chlorite dismutase
MATGQQEKPTINVNERGAERDGKPQVMNRRLFMQLLVFDCTGELGAPESERALVSSLERRGIAAVVYHDVNNPRGLALLTWSEDPAHFVTHVRPMFAEQDLQGLELKPDLTMLGRSYSSGFEPDLEFWLLERPRTTALDESCPWAVWYPLRRSGAFEQLEPREKGGILREHAVIGRAYGEAGLAHDIRLACHGLDANDSEFVIGLVGKDLHPLSHVVQTMRGTRQTSTYISQMGPFFVGRVAWRSAGSSG